MFYQYSEGGMREIAPEKLDACVLSVGYVTAEELERLNPMLGFDPSAIDACSGANRMFRTGVEIHRDYTFTELRIMNDPEEEDDYVALFLRRNLVLVVDISDEDGSTARKYRSAAERYPMGKVCAEKILSAFLDALLSGDHVVLEGVGEELNDLEEKLLGQDVDKEFNLRLFGMKKQLSKRYNYYAQLLDIAEAVVENDNEIFDEGSLIYIDNVAKRIARLHSDTAALIGTVEHLQDAYRASLDSSMNNTMKIFTVLTSIFFPLTIIVGWYGMNFRHMPELEWRYGYVYVILLSVAVVLAFAVIGKRKKWF